MKESASKLLAAHRLVNISLTSITPSTEMAFGEQSYTDDKLARALNISCTIIVSFEYVARVN